MTKVVGVSHTGYGHTQRMAQETRQDLEKETAIADIQKQIVQADQGVQIAEAGLDRAEDSKVAARLSLRVAP